MSAKPTKGACLAVGDRSRELTHLLAATAALTLAACSERVAPDEPAATEGVSSEPGQYALVAGRGGLETYFDCLSDAGVALVSAHRGGPAPGYPENALETFAHTLARTPAMLEVDVRATADNVLVLMHDDDLARTTTCLGTLSGTRWDELSACRLADAAGRATSSSIPALDDALAWAAGRTILELDIKNSVEYEDVIAAVRAADAEERVVLISTSLGSAGVLHRLAPELVVSVGVGSAGDLDALEGRGIDLDQVVGWTGTESVDPALNDMLEAEAVPVKFGTLGDPRFSIDGEIARSGDDSRYFEIARAGVDQIGTDRPADAYAALIDASGEETYLEALATCGG